MKKCISWLMIVIMIIVLAGCGKSDKKLLEEYIGCIKDIPAEVTENFSLPRTINNKNDHYIDWSSDKVNSIRIGNIGEIDGKQVFTANVTRLLEDETVTLTAELVIANTGLSEKKDFKVIVKAKEVIQGQSGGVLDAKFAAKGTSVAVEGVVTALTTNGFVVSDKDASIFVYKGEAKLNDRVDVKGTKDIYYNMPQIKDATVTVLASNATFDVQYATKTYNDFKNTADTTTEFYTTFVSVEGVVAEGDEHTPYKLMQEDGTSYILISKYTPTAMQNELKNAVGKKVKINAFVYDTYKGEWRLVAVLGDASTGGDTPVGGDTTTLKVSEAISKATADGVDVKTKGVVTVLLSSGVVITDDTGSIVVFGNQFTAEINDEIEVSGKAKLYYNLPEIAYPTVNKIGTGSMSVEYNDMSFEELNALDNTKNDSYTKFINVVGRVENDENNPYKLSIDGTDNAFYISKYTNQNALTELQEYLGKYVKIKAIIYDYHSTYKCWRVAYVGNAIEEVTPPVIDNEAKFLYAKTQIEKLNNSVVKANMELISKIEAYNLSVEWTSSNENIISVSGVFTQPETDTEVTLNANVKLEGESLGVVEIKVTAKAKKVVSGEENEYLLDFVKSFNDYAADWSTSYTSHTVTASDLGVEAEVSIALSNANKQNPTNAINDRPVVASKATEQYITVSVDECSITEVTFNLKEWSESKKFITLTIQYSTDEKNWVDTNVGVKGATSAVRISDYEALSYTDLPDDVVAVRLVVNANSDNNTQVGLTSINIKTK